MSYVCASYAYSQTIADNYTHYYYECQEKHINSIIKFSIIIA